MAPFRRAIRHRPVRPQPDLLSARRAADRARRTIDREYVSALRHLR
jgi:hypothetical protein